MRWVQRRCLFFLSSFVEIRDADDAVGAELVSIPIPFGDMLKDPEIANVLTFVRNSFGSQAMVAMVFNGRKVRDRVRIHEVWGGPSSGVDGGNDGGKGIADTSQGLKRQCEGHDIRYRNAWIQELDLKEADTDF